ncbi:MAG: alkaline phosphatase family protein [Chitinophagales bacterium]|nr:alkaline phosphatase family protein [Chitinophagales bacterium]
MNVFSTRLVTLFVILAIASQATFLHSCKSASAEKQEGALVPTAAHVIVIGVDGMSPDGVEKANTPVMDDLMKNGAYTLHARGVLPTSSSPNWASMIMGAGTEQHGMTSNDYERDDFPFTPVVTGMEDIFPTIFGTIRQQKKDAEIGAIYHWDGFGRLFEKSAVNYDKHIDGEKETAADAAKYIKEKKPTFTFIHLDHVDGAGHGEGHGTPAYYKAVSLADSLIGVIIQAAKDAGIYDNTIIIVSADHGGIGTGHGGESLAELEIPFIIAGKGIKKGYKIKQPVYTYDNAATVAYALGVQQPYAWIGRPVKAAFEGQSEPAGSELKEMLAAPKIYPDRVSYSPPGGLYVNKDATVEIKSELTGVEIRYTLDGTEPNKNSTLYNGPFALNKSAIVKARVFDKNGKNSLSAEAFFRVIKPGSGNGVKYAYYESPIELSYVPVMQTMKPVRTGTVYELRIDSIQHRDAQFAIMLDGYLQIDTPGAYRFYTSSDDGSKLYIDGELVTDNDGDHGVRSEAGDIEIKTPGRHAIKVTYFNGGGGNWLDVMYKGPGIGKQIIPADKLFVSAK